MAPLPYTSSGARATFYTLLGLFALLELGVRVRSGLNPHGSRSDRRSRLLVYVAVTSAMLGAFALAGAHGTAIRAARWPVFVAGSLLMALGIAVRQWAVATLGRFFTTDVRVHSDQTVVDDGPYRWVRHPSYSGMLATLAGVGLALGSWAALGVLLVLPTLGFVYRIHIEEQALLEGLGEPYHRFASSRARLVPGVW